MVSCIDRPSRFSAVCARGLAISALTVCSVVLLAGAGVRAQPAQPAGSLFTEAQAKRGSALYMENCAQCHRFDLAGGVQAPALTGQAFTLRWGGKPLSEIFDYLRTAMPLNSPGGLSDQQNADLLAFMLQKSGHVAGTSELPASSQKLTGLKLAVR